MTDEEQIRTTLAAYCQWLDDARFDEWSQLFTLDARFIPLGNVAKPRQEIVGRDQIRQWAYETFPDRERIGRHLTMNAIIAVDGDTATARSDVLMLWPSEAGPSPVLVGRYEDTLARQDGRWRFAVREVIVATQSWLAPELGAVATGQRQASGAP